MAKRKQLTILVYLAVSLLLAGCSAKKGMEEQESGVAEQRTVREQRCQTIGMRMHSAASATADNAYLRVQHMDDQYRRYKCSELDGQ